MIGRDQPGEAKGHGASRLRAVLESSSSTPLLVTLALWVCVMLITAAVVTPLAGWGATISLGSVALIGLLLVCWMICVPFERTQKLWRDTVIGAAGDPNDAAAASSLAGRPHAALRTDEEP